MSATVNFHGDAPIGAVFNESVTGGPHRWLSFTSGTDSIGLFLQDQSIEDTDELAHDLVLCVVEIQRWNKARKQEEAEDRTGLESEN